MPGYQLVTHKKGKKTWKQNTADASRSLQVRWREHHLPLLLTPSICLDSSLTWGGGTLQNQFLNCDRCHLQMPSVQRHLPPCLHDHVHTDKLSQRQAQQKGGWGDQDDQEPKFGHLVAEGKRHPSGVGGTVCLDSFCLTFIPYSCAASSYH